MRYIKINILFIFFFSFFYVKSQDTLFFNTFNQNDTEIENIFSSNILDSGQTYCLQVEGTYSIWPSSFWSSPCGLIEPNPIFPSQNVSLNGNVGFDAEYIFSFPRSSLCSGITFPFIATPTPRIEISTDSGKTWFGPQTNSPYNSNHIYNYLIYGEGFSLGVRQNSAVNSDDYGILQFRMQKAPNINLGRDTILCSGQSIVLDATSFNSTYLWQDGSTNSTFTVDTVGQYNVQVTNDCTTYSDTINVNFYPAINLDLGRDTILCSGQSIVLDAKSINSTYLWQDGSTDSIFTATTAGQYWVQVFTNGCSKRDTINVDTIPTMLINLGRDTILCSGQSIVLDATSFNSTYLWQDGSTNSIFTVDTVGQYNVQVTNDCTTYSDTINVNFYPAINLDLGRDTILCSGQSIVLDAKSINSTYLWQDGSTDSIYTATTAGQYWVQVFKNVCTESDTINVDTVPPILLNLGEDKSLCIEATLQLNITNPHAKYLWQDGSTDSTFIINSEGIYFALVQNTCEIKSDTLIITAEDCDCNIIIPNIYTPNNDGINDVFFPKFDCDFAEYELRIFNRWGENVYNTVNPNQVWDGRFNGEKASDGSYFYLLKYKSLNGLSKTLVGNITLIR